MRVIVPPLTNQYLNLTKNSSLAVAVGYPDLVQVFAGTVLNQTGQAVEVIAITMAVYLTISLVTSGLMNCTTAASRWWSGDDATCRNPLMSVARWSNREPPPLRGRRRRGMAARASVRSACSTSSLTLRRGVLIAAVVWPAAASF